MLVSFNPAISKNRYSNNKSQNVSSRAQNPNFKGTFFTPETIANGGCNVSSFLKAIGWGFIPKNEETINTMKKAVAIADKAGESPFGVQNELNRIINYWEENKKFPDKLFKDPIV